MGELHASKQGRPNHHRANVFFAETLVQRRWRNFPIVGATTRRPVPEGLSLQHHQPRRLLGRTCREAECRRNRTVRLSVSWSAGQAHLNHVLVCTFYNFDSLSSDSELLSHENITWNDNGTISTIPHHPLEWRQDLSGNRSEDDILYLPNIALLVSRTLRVTFSRVIPTGTQNARLRRPPAFARRLGEKPKQQFRRSPWEKHLTLIASVVSCNRGRRQTRSGIIAKRETLS